jgi:hypothetical protein
MFLEYYLLTKFQEMNFFVQLSLPSLNPILNIRITIII